MWVRNDAVTHPRMLRTEKTRRKRDDDDDDDDINNVMSDGFERSSG